jgi:DNA-binding transcriptional regulator YhcF (GntR family)
LLTLADRLHDETLHITQEHMANMVSVRRSSITDAVQTLREAGLVETGRGIITILDRERMEAQACECYAVIKEAIETFTT